MRYNLYNKLLLQLRCNDLDSTIKASTCTTSKYYSYMFYADRNVRPCTILGYTLTTFPKSLIQTKTTKRTSTKLRAEKEEEPCIIGGESGQRRKRTLHNWWKISGQQVFYTARKQLNKIRKGGNLQPSKQKEKKKKDNTKFCILFFIYI